MNPSSAARSTLHLSASSAAFALLYATSNHLTSLRGDVGAGLTAWDHAVPFVPWTIVPYLSIVPLFVLSFFAGRGSVALHVRRLAWTMAIALVCFAAFPLRFAFERPVVDGWFGALYALLSAVDLPYNRAPSLHVAFVVLLWLRLVPALPPSWRWALQGWLLLIAASVLTTWQHHVIDIAAGAAVAAVACALAPLSSAACRTFFRWPAWARPTRRASAH